MHVERLWFGYGVSGDRMPLERERKCSLGMDALVTVCSYNTDGIMAWACCGTPYALYERNYGLGMYAAGPRMLLEHARNFGFGMDDAGPHMLSEHKRNFGLGMDVVVSVCSWNTNGRGLH